MMVQEWQKEFDILFCSINPTNPGQLSKPGTLLEFGMKGNISISNKAKSLKSCEWAKQGKDEWWLKSIDE